MRLGVSHEHWYHFVDRFGSDTSGCPTRVAARSQLGLRPERNRRGHRRDLARVSVDGSPVVPRVNCEGIRAKSCRGTLVGLLLSFLAKNLVRSQFGLLEDVAIR